MPMSVSTHLNKVRLYQVRNLVQIDIALTQCNVFIGKNGSGKTSLLEAMFLLSRGKSFRHHQPKHYIHHGSGSCTVWGQTGEGDTFAIAKEQDATTTLRHNGMNIAQSQMSKALPMLVIDPSGMDMLEAGSATRRQMLDWLGFYLHEGFYGAWSDYNRLLKQRNALLRPFFSQNSNQIHVWNAFLSQYATAIHAYRQAVFEQWQVGFDALVGELLPKYQHQLCLNYQAGFDTKLSLGEILTHRFAQDVELGYTRIGTHRADIGITIKSPTKSEQAINVLSRGEKKLLIVALRLSQLSLLCQMVKLPTMPIVLIDDIEAELDERAVRILLTALLKLPCQLFITNLDDGIIKTIDDIKQSLNDTKPIAIFDVAEGQVVKRLIES